MLILKNLTTLNICYNDFETIPNILPSLNSSMNQKVKVLICTFNLNQYENKIKWRDPSIVEFKEEMKQKNIHLVLSRH